MNNDSSRCEDQRHAAPRNGVACGSRKSWQTPHVILGTEVADTEGAAGPTSDGSAAQHS